MTARPSVSALICVHNGEPYLAEAIESALRQTVPPAEVIVVEHGSTDRSADVARSYVPDVRLIEMEEVALGGARAATVEQSSGDLVAFLDSDDVWEPRKLELQLEAFARDPELDYVFTLVREFASERDAQRFDVREGELPGGLASALCARREAIDRAGGFDVDLPMADIMTWLTRARARGLREHTVQEVLVRRRIHENNLTRRRRGELLGDYAKVLKASLDERKEAG